MLLLSLFPKSLRLSSRVPVIAEREREVTRFLIRLYEEAELEGAWDSSIHDLFSFTKLGRNSSILTFDI